MLELPEWQTPPDQIDLPGNAVHFWRIKLDQINFPFSRLWSLLSEDEQNRANRFYLKRDRQRFVVGRAALRLILAKYLNTTSPEHLQFSYGPNGKPGTTGLEFNFSNSDELGLLGLSRYFTLGVDLEKLQSLEYEQIAKNFFSTRETNILTGLPVEQRPVAFFNAWTRKEAYLKATGKGLSHSLSEIEVSFVPGEPAQFLASLPELTGWTLDSFTPQEGFVGAAAIHALRYQSDFFNWPN